MYRFLILTSVIALSMADSTPKPEEDVSSKRNANEQQQQQKTIKIASLASLFPKPHPLPLCGPNEILSDCVTPCQPSCEFPHQLPCPEFSARTGGGLKDSSKITPPTIIITKPLPALPPPSPPSPCHVGCLCAIGFVRNELGLCIPKSECPAICKPNSHFEACGPRCQPTCDIAQPRSLSVCTATPKVCYSGCFCNSGYVKDLRTSQCVKPEHCSHVCPDNEHYSDCGTTCVATCHQPNYDYNCKNNTVPLPGCYCNQGFVRDKVTKACVREYDCKPISCSLNEEYYKCKPCTPTCLDLKPVCPHICYPGCDCSKGYVRNPANNKCIKLCECPNL